MIVPWDSVQLGIIADVVMGQSPPGKTYNEEGHGLPFFQGKTDFGDRFPTVRKWCSEPARVAEAGDILLSVRAPVGPTNVAHERSCIGHGLAAIRVRAGRVERGYLRHFLRHREGALLHQGQGSTLSAINRRDIETLEVPIPSPSEQRRIVHVLDQVEQLRRLRAEADTKAGRILPALFLKMFGDPVTNPMGWRVKPLGKLGELERGRSVHRPRNDSALLGGPHPFIQTGEVANCGGRIREFTQTYSELGLAQSKIWPAGTLCITIAANIANTGVLEFDACFPDSVVGFVPGSSTTTEYVQFLLFHLREMLERNAPQLAQRNINLQVLRSLAVPAPPTELQRQFSSYVCEYYDSRIGQITARDVLDTLFASTVGRAFSGALTKHWRERAN